MAVTAFGAAIVATTAAIEGQADAGVEVDDSGRVVAVSTTSIAWSDGIWPGQVVVKASNWDSGWGTCVVETGVAGPIAPD